MKRILVVGAGGFAGGFIVEEGLRRGFEVWAGVRSTTSRKWLGDARIKFIEFDYDNKDALAASINKVREENGPDWKWDYIIYNLGATKVMRYADFSRINYEYLRNFMETLSHCDVIPERLLYLSSLSAVGPIDGTPVKAYTEEIIPHPNTRYGASKLKAEVWLATAGIPYIIFRATGIYGPRDHDYFLMFESIAKGFDFSVGYRRQLLSFIYVADLAEAIYEALEKAPVGEVYNISEPRAYTQKEFRKIAARKIGKKFVIPMRMPLWAVKFVSAVAEKWGVARMKPSTLNLDKYKIMRQRNWSVDVSKAENDFGFAPKTDLETGVSQSIDWYKKEGWLKSPSHKNLSAPGADLGE